MSNISMVCTHANNRGMSENFIFAASLSEQHTESCRIRDCCLERCWTWSAAFTCKRLPALTYIGTQLEI